MALAVVGGAALGTLFGALYDVVKEGMGKTTKFKALLGGLKSTLDSLEPLIIQQIGEQNLELGLPNEDIEDLKRTMEEEVNIVRTLSGPRWVSCNCLNPRCTDRLVELDESLKRLLEKLKVQEVRDVKETLLLARKNAEKRWEEQMMKKQEAMEAMQEIKQFIATQNTENLLELEESIKRALATHHNAVNVNLEGSWNIEKLFRDMERNEVLRVGWLVEGAAVLGAVEELLNVLIHVKSKNKSFRPLLKDLKSTMISLKEQIEKRKELRLLREETEYLRKQIQECVRVVRTCSEVTLWNNYNQHEYASKLVDLDKYFQNQLGTLKKRREKSAN